MPDNVSTALRAVTQPTVRQGIISEIKRYIINNNVKAGQRLPSINRMAAQMHVSMSALREALYILDTHGMLSIVNGKGVYVINPEMARLDVDDTDADNPEYLIDVINVRWLLETEVVRQVVRRATDKQLDMLGELVDKLMERYNAGLDDRDEDKAFHLALYSITNNNALASTLSVVIRSFVIVWEYPMGLNRPFYDTAPEHAELYHAIRARNEALAVSICERTRLHMVSTIKEAASTLGVLPSNKIGT